MLKRTTLSSSQQYAYDKAGRLTTAKDTQEGACTTRIYAFENEAGRDSNRTSMTTRPPEIGGAPRTTKAALPSPTPTTRPTGLPAKASPTTASAASPACRGKYAGGSTLETKFEIQPNDRQSTPGAASRRATPLDATGRVRQVTQSGTKEGTEVFHYSLVSDSTAWTERASTSYADVTGHRQATWLRSNRAQAKEL